MRSTIALTTFLRGCLRSLICFLLSILCIAGHLHAQSQQTSCVITTRGTASDSLDVTFLLECGSAEPTGALHFDVRSTAGASSRDRDLEIIFSLAGHPDGQYPTVHRTKVTLKEGATSTQGSLPFVLNNLSDLSGQRLQFWNVSVWEDGRNMEGVRGMQIAPGGTYLPVRMNPGESPSYMFLQRGAQSNSALQILHDAEASNPRWVATGLKQETPVFDLSRDVLRTTSVRHVRSLPETWYYYLQFRYVTLTSDALEQLRKERPNAAEAIKQFVAAGGNLLLVSDDDEGWKRIDQWLSNQPGDDKLDVDWVRAYDNPNIPIVRPKAGEPQPEKTEVDDDSPTNLYLRPYLRGHFYSLKGEQSDFTTKMMLGMPGSVGLAASNAYDEGWALRNMIASVGKPPVWTFCTIILLFGIVLGPGLLILTGWIGRRSLLILLVPLVSLGATFAIVAYEVLHEGFGTYSRITSVVTIDEASGEGFAWSRQTYFSGWPPREGLAIPNNVFCRVVGNFAMGRMDRNHPSNQYSVTHSSDQSIWSNVIPAREQRQFLIGHSIKTSIPFEVKAIDAQHISIRNLTATTLPFVVLRDGKDGYYFAEKVPPESEIELAIQAFDDIAGTLSRMRSEHVPALPMELRSLGWAFNQNQSNFEVLDQIWISSLSEQAAQSSIRPFGFVTATRASENIFVPLKADTQESLTLVTGRVAW